MCLVYHLTKPQVFLSFFEYEKHPQSLLYNIAASMWGLLMFYLVKCFYLHLWLIIFEAGDSIRKPASMWKDGASLGPTPHSV